MSPLPRAGATRTGAGLRSTFVLAQSLSHDKISQTLVPATRLSSPAKGLTAARCYNRELWTHWVIWGFFIVQVGIAFIFKPSWHFLSDLSEQLLLNVFGT